MNEEKNKEKTFQKFKKKKKFRSNVIKTEKGKRISVLLTESFFKEGEK